MKMWFLAAAAVALASLGGCPADPQSVSANNTQCIPDSVGDVSPDAGAGTHCNPTDSNPITALWSTTAGQSSAAHASASPTRPSLYP